MESFDGFREAVTRLLQGCCIFFRSTSDLVLEGSCLVLVSKVISRS